MTASGSAREPAGGTGFPRHGTGGFMRMTGANVI